MEEQFQPPVCARIKATRVRLKQEAQAASGTEAAREFSQERVAQRLHLSLKAYRAYEKDREPNFTRRKQIANALGLDALFFETPEQTPRDQALDDLRREVAELRGEVARLLHPPKPARRRRSS